MVSNRRRRELRYAATAPQDDDDPAAALPDHIKRICADLGWWVASRRLYAPNPRLQSVLGSLGRRVPSGVSSGPDACCDADMQRFYRSVMAQPDGKDKDAFILHYIARVRTRESAARRLGVTRRHWYRLVNAFALRAHAGMSQFFPK